jgi:hypothetical protein
MKLRQIYAKGKEPTDIYEYFNLLQTNIITWQRSAHSLRRQQQYYCRFWNNGAKHVKHNAETDHKHTTYLILNINLLHSVFIC